jgi:hypothetical protein
MIPNKMSQTCCDCPNGLRSAVRGPSIRGDGRDSEASQRAKQPGTKVKEKCASDVKCSRRAGSRATGGRVLLHCRLASPAVCLGAGCSCCAGCRTSERQRCSEQPIRIVTRLQRKCAHKLHAVQGKRDLFTITTRLPRRHHRPPPQPPAPAPSQPPPLRPSLRPRPAARRCLPRLMWRWRWRLRWWR